MAENYYEILSIPRNATSAEIKAAYRRLVLQYHPDKNENNVGAEQQFRKIRIAYETLINPEKRKDYDNFLLGKTAFRKHYFVITRKAYRAIRLIPSKRVVRLDETFEVVAKSQLHGNKFYISGLEWFDIISGPEYAMEQEDKTKNVLVRYTLKPRQLGYLAIGPAVMCIDNIRFESERLFIKVKEKDEPIYRFALSRGENIFYISVIAFFVFLFALTFYNIKERGLMPDELLIDEKLRNRRSRESDALLQLSTGAIPYMQWSDPRFSQQSSNNIVRILNGKYQDAVVFVLTYPQRKIVRNYYIRATDKFEIRYLPDGLYYIKVMFGNDWNPLKTIEGTDVTGGFNYNQRYEAFTDSTEILSLYHRMKNDTMQHSVYEISLFPVFDGRARSKKMSEYDFFK